VKQLVGLEKRENIVLSNYDGIIDLREMTIFVKFDFMEQKT